MAPTFSNFSELPEDAPIPLLFRKRIAGSRILVAQVRLLAGCHVPEHHHESEQVALIMSGKSSWTVGGESRDATAGDVVVIPSNVPHEVRAVEDTLIIDILSPPAAMGVDNVGK